MIFSQTVLTTFPLELKKSKQFKQITTAENKTTRDVFVFASDKETLTILKYNSALFLSNQYVLPRPDISYKLISGYSFDKQGNPTLYWSNEDLTKILAVQYDINSQATMAIFSYELPFLYQNIIAQFQENNTFYILAQNQLEQKLELYVFKDGKKEEKTLDFGTFKFKNSSNKDLTLNQILEACPIEKIETDQFNPLFRGTQRSKLYVLSKRLLITLDHNDNETQAFDIDLESFEIKEKIFLKSVANNGASSSNSYYHERKIYQLQLNADALLFEIKDYETADTLKSIRVLKTDTIPFKTSPFRLQMGGNRAKELKTTAKFLNQLLYLNVGLTVYKTNNSIMITLGATGNIQFADVIGSNSNQFDSGVMYRSVPTTVYFESVFDKKLENTKKFEEPLAVDFISRFVQEHAEVSLSSIFRYRNYYILAYYDIYAQQYTMRKFIDGFQPTF